MQSKASRSTLKKLIEICARNQILNIERVNTFPNLHYGPLGSLLKRNIFNEWLSSLLRNNDFHMFPVEIPNPRKEYFLLQKQPKTSTECLLPAVLDNYLETVNLFGSQTPFGFAVYGPCVNQQTLQDNVVCDTDFKLLRNVKAWTRISVIFFCPSTKPMHWFHYWSKQRYLWWRKVSSIPSKFSLSEVVKDPSGSQQLSLLLESPWGKDRLETVTVHESAVVKGLFQKYHSEKSPPRHPGFGAPAIVTCEAELDLAVLAYLLNSYAEKCREGEFKNVLQLHYELAPYKVCISLDEDADVENVKKLKNVASHLTKELKDTGISIFPSPSMHLKFERTSQFEKFDEMGIPYTIVLNKSSLLTGVAGLRSRDTTLQEQIHITELTSRLVKYLKTKREMLF